MEATEADMGTRREVELSEFDDDFLPCPLLQSLELRNVYKSKRIAARAHELDCTQDTLLFRWYLME